MSDPYEKALEKVTEALKTEGFGVLTEIDVKATLKKKIDAAGGRLILYGPRPLLREMFAFTKLADFFVIVATEADALRMLKRGDTKQRRVVPTA